MDYFNTSKESWKNFLQIRDEDIPEKLIIDGKINYPKWTEVFINKVKKGKIAWMPNLAIGALNKKKIGYGVCFGGPIASQFSHIYCKMGTKKIIQIGTGGGLQPNIKLGDIIVSEGVLSIDGSAKLYKQNSTFIEFDKGLKNDVVSELEDRKIPFHVGRTVCIYDILLEEYETFSKLSSEGFIGSEMESGAVGSVAKYFNVPAISYFVCADNASSGKGLLAERTTKEQKKIENGLESAFDIALNI